jgi:hypothetical protein
MSESGSDSLRNIGDTRARLQPRGLCELIDEITPRPLGAIRRALSAWANWKNHTPHASDSVHARWWLTSQPLRYAQTRRQ